MGGAAAEPEHPLAVLCGREQACALIVWHNHLPTYEQVSFSCDGARRGRPGPRPRLARHHVGRAGRGTAGAALNPPTHPPLVTREETYMNSHLILIVEEEEAARAFLADQLAADGYEIMLAESGRHALHQLADAPAAAGAR